MKPSIHLIARCISRLIATLVLISLGVTAQAGDEPKVLNIYNWAEYIPDDTIARFEKETGIKVRYDTYDSNEVLHTKLLAGKSGYDIVVPSANWAALQIQAGLFRRLDKSALPNLKNLDADLLAKLAVVDPGNQYLVNWAWGFTTVGINVDKVKAALGTTPMPDDVWKLFFDPQYSKQLKSCGISILDSATDVFPAVLHYLGKNAFSANSADYLEAAKVLKAIRPNIKLFSSSGYINDLANGGLCMVFGYSGDINIAAQRARETQRGTKIVALVSTRGAPMFYDNMAIPVDAKHPGNAHLFINYMMRPEVAASVTNKMRYPTMNRASIQFLSKDVRDNPSIVLSDAAKKSMIASGTTTSEMRRMMTRLFTQFKTGI